MFNIHGTFFLIFNNLLLTNNLNLITKVKNIFTLKERLQRIID